MRTSHIILALAGLIGCVACYSVGFLAGTRESPLREEHQGNLLIALRTYQAAERTNWIKVQSTLGIQVLALTRDYERRFGVPKGTNRFVQHFAEAKALADRTESQLVRLDSIFTNVPSEPKVK